MPGFFMLKLCSRHLLNPLIAGGRRRSFDAVVVKERLPPTTGTGQLKLSDLAKSAPES
jgi:hypothetical protein